MSEQSDVAALFARLKEEVRAAGPRATDVPPAQVRLSVRDQAERLWAISAERPIVGTAGPVKSVLRRLMRWYVEPAFADQRAFNDGYRAWTTSNASIGAKIQAYFGNDLGSQWRSFANVVTDYFQLSATPGGGRAEQVQEILSYGELPTFVRLSKGERRALVKSNSSATFQNAYGRLGQAMLARGDELVQGVLDSGVSGL